MTFDIENELVASLQRTSLSMNIQKETGGATIAAAQRMQQDLNSNIISFQGRIKNAIPEIDRREISNF